MVAKELRRFNIDIAALSETRFEEEGQLTEHGADYTLFWKGRQVGEYRQRNHGVGFAIKNEIIPKLVELPVGVNERLMTLRMKLANNQHATLISVETIGEESVQDQWKEIKEHLSVICREVIGLSKRKNKH